MRKPFVILIAVIIVVGVGIGIFLGATRDSTNRVDVDEVAAGSGGANDEIEAGNRPTPGTYRMTGAGSERASLLNGSEHVFGDEVAQTVSFDEEGCAFTARFDWVDQSVMHRYICAEDDGIRELGYDTAITFFTIKTERGYECPDTDDAYWWRQGDEPGTTRKRTCTGDDTTMNTTATFAGTETMRIDGEELEVRRIDTSNAFKGGVTGSSKTTFWITDAGLIVRVHTVAKTNTDTALGESDYTADYDYTLASLTPA